MPNYMDRLPADTDSQMLRVVGNAVVELGVRYRLASFDEQVELSAELDRAFNAYALARLNLIRSGLITTSADVAAMEALAKEMDEAADMAALLIVAGKIASKLARLALMA